jgi:hypothetical protein
MSDFTIVEVTEDAEVQVIMEGTQGVAGPTGPQGIQGPQGSVSDTNPVTTSEALEAGDLVNIWSDAGQHRARRASAAAAGMEAHGYVMAPFALGATATVYFEGTNSAMTGLTPGKRFLSATQPGKTQAIPPSDPGQVVQRVGFAVSATAMNFDSGEPIALA